jgi:hypothetical protein
MSENQNIPWKRLSVEAAAIVGSILLAFAIDAWWQERLERNDEREQLARLRAEFTENIRMIDRRTFEPIILDACKEFFDLIQSAQDAGNTSIELPAFTLVRTLNVPTYEAHMPILNGLMRSGLLELIEDRRVLEPIAEWERLLRDYTSFAERARRGTDSHLLPALTLRGDIGPHLMITSAFNNIQPAQFRDEKVTIRIDEELKGLVAARWRNGNTAVNTLGRARKAADVVIAAIDAAQAN